MNWNKWFRQAHRWVALAFAAGVTANIIAIMNLQGSDQTQPAPWISLLALLPLALLLVGPVLVRPASRAEAARRAALERAGATS